MRILVADDVESARLLLMRFVEALGHEAISACDGQEAIAQWQQAQPDLILMDMLMPGVSGLQAATLIKQQAKETWVPIVFISGAGEEKILAEAIECCADDYLNKPVNFRVLRAKLNAFGRTLELNRRVREQSEKLANYYERSEEEKRVVHHLMDQLVSAERLTDPQVAYWLCPAESLSGDLIGVARTPGRVLHLLLADGIGHGISAALNVLPLMQPFYSMTERGHSLPEILIEMNNKVRQVLPVGRFVAVALISVSEADHCIEIWNGGMPEQKILDAAGHVIEVCKSFSLPLGIVPSAMMDFTPRRFCVDQPGAVLAYSDGLVEARNPDGEPFGETRLLEAVCGVRPHECMAAIQFALQSFMREASLHDDVSVVMANFGNAMVQPEIAAKSSSCINVVELEENFQKSSLLWRYELVLGAEELRYISFAPFIMDFVLAVKKLHSHASDVFQIVEALFLNALDYGLLCLCPASGLSRAERSAYVSQERRKRLDTLQHGQITLDLAGFEYEKKQFLRIRVKDSGQGFDWRASVSDQEPLDLRGGQGIRLIRTLSAGVHYPGNGNETIVYYVLP